jgi:hypothetical protein
VEFDAFVAMDWSGASGDYDGISVAMCLAGRVAPKLVSPRGPRWSREEAAEWIKEHVGRRQRLLIGLDFGFGFPFEDTGYLGGQAPDIDDIFALWALIEAKSAGEGDFGCNRFLNDLEITRLFWKRNAKPGLWVERKRRAEYACAETTGTRPDSLYKLLGPKQVGKASITGMRVLNHLRACKGDCVAIWPFETPRTSVIVEIYPTMFRKLATRSIAKLRSRADLNRALAVLGSRPIPVTRSPLSDHETDALISAAGLRYAARDPKVWTRPELDSPRVQREGWIFGI